MFFMNVTVVIGVIRYVGLKPQILHGMVCHDGSRLHHEKQKDVKIVNDIK